MHLFFGIFADPDESCRYLDSVEVIIRYEIQCQDQNRLLEVENALKTEKDKVQRPDPIFCSDALSYPWEGPDSFYQYRVLADPFCGFSNFDPGPNKRVKDKGGGGQA